MANALTTYFQHSWQELKKVTWPTKHQAIRLTIITLVFCAMVTAFIAAVDYLFNLGYTALLNLAS